MRLAWAATTGLEPYALYRFDTSPGMDSPADLATVGGQRVGALFRTDDARRIGSFLGPDGNPPPGVLYRKRLDRSTGDVQETVPVYGVGGPVPAAPPASGPGGGGPDLTPEVGALQTAVGALQTAVGALSGSVAGQDAGIASAVATAQAAATSAATAAQQIADLTVQSAAVAPRGIPLVGYGYGTLRLVRENAGAVVFSAANQNPASDAAAPTTSGSTISWISVVNARHRLGSTALDAYYLYYSTDHAGGGVWLATAPNPSGPWTGRGRVWAGAGYSTETPSVIWDDDEAHFKLYCHTPNYPGANGAQTTILATSSDGLTWTGQGIALDVPAGSKFPGDGHTGYFRPWRLGRKWYAYHLLGGTDYAHFGMSRSDDGRVWDLDPRPLGYGVDQTSDPDYRIEWNSGSVVQWDARIWWIGQLSVFTSGGGTKTSKIVAAPLAPDLRSLVGRPEPQLLPLLTGAGESTDIKGVHAHVDEQGVLRVFYQMGYTFRIARAVLT